LKTLVCLVRHGVTEWNYDARAQGVADIPLAAEGERQAELVAGRLAQEPWDALYSSPLRRAAATAEAIGRRTGLPVHLEADMVERDCGPVEGTTFRDRQLRWPGVRLHDMPGVESDAAVGIRATGIITELVRRHAGQRILCVAHGGFIHNFLEAQGLDSGWEGDKFQRNTSITRVWWNGERFVREGGSDYAHLLVDGVEYSGEKGRVMGVFRRLDLPSLSQEVVEMATGIESAWVKGELVGFARAFSDGVLYGYVDVVAVVPGYESVLPVLMDRLQARFAGARFTRLGVPQVDLPVQQPASAG
jgi:2,3-bisphosphoglycerate-dependent phosphoglycerate mutase